MNKPILSRRFRYGGAAFALTAVIIAVIILFNWLFSALANKLLWYTDLTPEGLYTLSDEAVDAIKDIDKDVTILFCNDPDNLMDDAYMSYIYETALGLEKANEHVSVETVNIYRNPSAVSYYKTNSRSNIYATDVIVTSGTEFRVYQERSMFVFNTETDTTPWSYNGEKKLCTGILAVTRAESPICCITYNHGEPFATESQLTESEEILSLLYDAGYDIQLIDLANDEIPEDCRMMLVYDPQSDFLVKEEGISDKSEIEKLDKFLDGTNALMCFVDPETPVLPNLEEYLEEWGITFDRYTQEALGTGIKGATLGCAVKDDRNSTTQDGMSIVGGYTSTGLGASLHKDLRTTYPPKVIFPNVMGISYAANYSEHLEENPEDSSQNYTYYEYYSNGVSRAIFDVFVSADNAVEMAGGNEVRKATSLNPFRLMTITRELKEADNTQDYCYVIACGSTEFLSNRLLRSNTYGNTDVMLSTLRAIGREITAVDLDHKPFASTKMENITIAQQKNWTAALIILPAVLSLGVGVYVLVRRKYAR